jgi:hypothetical protein
MTFEPTDAEQKLIAAVRGGRVAGYSSGDPAQDDPTGGRAWHGERTIRSEIICHTVQQNGRCKCGASEWPHRIELNLKPCFVGGGKHNFAADNICQDCGNTRASR